MRLISGVKKALRQKAAMDRLYSQLESGVKTKKGTRSEKVPLSGGDIKRIKKEIQTLETKIRDKHPHLLEDQKLAA